MKNLTFSFGVLIALLITTSSCKEEQYSLGDLTAPTNLVITADVVGKTTDSPNGDGSGNVKFTVSADNALSYKIDYDASTPVDLVFLTTGSATKKYTTLGVNTYRVTAIAYGKGGSSSSITKDIVVRSDYTIPASIVTALTGDASKTWVVDKSVAGHFGVGPWSNTSSTPEWWQAAVNEKVSVAPCFYTATYTFTKAANGTFSVKLTTDGTIFANGNAAENNLGIKASGEACYAYTGWTKGLSFAPAISGIVKSTGNNMLVAGTDGFVGYGSCTNTYEILTIDNTSMYLRSQGANPGNAWYIKLKSVQ